MKLKIKNQKVIASIIFLLVFGGALVAEAQVWNNPSCGPTGCNASTPINISSTTQTKSGVLFVGGLNALVDIEVGENVHANAFFYASDRNLKEKIVPLKNSLSNIVKLQGVSFSWKKDGVKNIGLIAQDVEKIYPEIVSTNAVTGLKSVEYGSLVAPLIEAVKEQQKEIEDLKKEIEQLKKMIN